MDAENYYSTGNFTQAMSSMNRVDRGNQGDAEYLLLLAKLHIALGEYEEALVALEGFRSEGGEDVLLDDSLYATIVEAKELSQKMVTKEPHGRLNSIHSEYAPIVNADGDFMILGSDRRSPFKGENIFYSALINGSWTEPMELKELCTDRNETVGSFDNEGNLYLSGQYGNRRKSYNNNIYISYKLNSEDSRSKNKLKWGKPQKIDALSSNFNDINPSFSNGNVMMFASNRLGDHKTYDIFVSEMEFGTWSRPIPLGSVINTNGNEITPYLAPGGHLLFFASDTHTGFGGFDLFVAKKIGPSWTDWDTPVNLGPIINSPNDERYFSLRNRSLDAYYSTTRFERINMENIVGIDLAALGYKLVHGYAHDDIDQRVQTTVNWTNNDHNFSIKTDENGEFSFLLAPTEKITYNVNDERYFEVTEDVDIKYLDNLIVIPLQRKNVLRLAGRVYDQYDDPVLTTIQWSFENEGLNERRSTATNNNGNYSTEVPQIRYIDFDINEPGYVPQKGRWNLVEGESYQTRDFILTAYARGQAYTFIVEFDFDKSDIRPNSMPEVVKMFNMLSENPTMKVEIAGHTDSRGTPPYNDGLSQRRANTVRNELIRRGIDRNRMTIGAYGLNNPISDNDTDEGRQRNRRVEMIILSIN